MATKSQFSAGGVVFRRAASGQLEVALIATQGRKRWGLPKGLLRKDEPTEDAALREVREETGLDARIVADLGAIEYWYWGNEGDNKRVRYHKRVHFFLMAYEGGDTAGHDFEVDEARWFPIDEAIRRASYRSEKEILERIPGLVKDSGTHA